MNRFLYSSTALKTFDSCPASFQLWEDGAPGNRHADNLLFGEAFHAVMQKYIDHCIENRRPSDITIVPKLIREAISETNLSTTYFDELTLLLNQFLAVYRIDFEHSVARERGVAFDWNLKSVSWSGDLEYSNLTKPADLARKVMFRLKLDELLLDADTRILTIRDFKTDRYAPSQTEINDPSSRFWQQARIYAWGAHRGIFPAEAVEVEFLFARHIVHGKILTRRILITPNDIDETQDLVLQKIALIEDASTFNARPGPQCAICSFRETACPVKAERPTDNPVSRMRRYLRAKVDVENLRDALKEDVAEFGFDGELGDLRAEFVTTEEYEPDMERLVAALQAEGIENWWAVMSFSKTDAKRVLDRDQFERVLAAAYDCGPGVRFNVHQKKEALIALAESRGLHVDKKATVHELALALAEAAHAPDDEFDASAAVFMDEVHEADEFDATLQQLEELR